MSKIIDFPLTNTSEIKIKIERTEGFTISANNVSEFIKNLALVTTDNDHLIALIIEQIQQAEKGAFEQGFKMGVQFAEYQQTNKE